MSKLQEQVLAACLASKEALELTETFGGPIEANFSSSDAMILKAIRTYYARDGTAEKGNAALIESILLQDVRSAKSQETLKAALDRVVSQAVDVSVPNVQSILLNARIHAVKDQLAAALVNGEKSKEAKLLEELRRLYDISNINDLIMADTDEVYTTENLDALIMNSFNQENILKVYPTSIGDRVGGGFLPGQHIVIGAVPNLGKSAMIVTMASGFAARGRKVLICCNEEPPAIYWMRFIQQLSNMVKEDVLADYSAAVVKAKLNGLDNIVIASLSPGTPAQIKSLIDKYTPDVMIIDQILHLNMGKVSGDSKTNSLEAAAAFNRAMALQNHMVTISVTQCGDSAYGRAVLEMRDLYQSHTGLQGTADIIILIGADKAQEEQGYRTVNIVKNKVNARHESFPVRLIVPLSKYANA